MNLLNGHLAWILAPLLALPIIIHLLNKRFPQRFYFPSVEHLRKTAAERSRIYRWRHRILTVVRTLFCLLLLLAFLKPVLDRFGNSRPNTAGRQVLLVVDASLSMEYLSGGLSSRARALIEAEKILANLGPQDEINVIAAGRSATPCFNAFSQDVAQARRFLQTLPPGISRADFSQANAAAARLLESARGQPEIYFISDFQRKNWGRVDFQPVQSSARLFFVDVGPADAANHAILGVELSQNSVLAGDSVPLAITVGNFSPLPLRENLTIRVDNQVELQAPVEAAPWSSARVLVPVPATAPGLRVCEVRLPPDNLPTDDRWTLTLPVLEKEEIATISSVEDTARDPVRFLHAALNPFTGRAGSLLPRHIPSAQLDPSRLASTRKAFITRCGPLDDNAATALAKFLQHGGSIVWFLDGDSDPDNLARLEKAAGAPILPIRLGPLRRTERVGTGAQQLTTGDFQSRFLRLFKGTLRQDLGLLEFYDFHTASATGVGKVLLRFADETPAFSVSDHGLGTLVLLNFSASELSSNLARQRIFPAWIQDLVKQLDTSEPVPVAWAAGQLVEAEVWREDLRRAQLTSPSGRVIEPRQEPLGERTVIRFPAEELGFYRLAGPRSPAAWAVNADPDESDLRPVDRNQLPVQEGTAGRFVAGQSDYQEVAEGLPLLRWILLAGLAALGLELTLQSFFRKLTP